MKYKNGDRVLYNRQKFGVVYADQTNQAEVDVVFDRRKNKIAAVRADMLELVADAQHEAHLAALINSPLATPAKGLAEELNKLATELEEGAVLDMNVLRVRANMRSVASRLRTIAEGM